MGSQRGGQKPKPPHLKIVEGNPGKRPIAPGVQLPPVAPKAPAWSEYLPGPRQVQARKDAADFWRRTVPPLENFRVLASVDFAILTDAAICWARLRECERTLSERGLTRKSEYGISKDPAVTVATQYRAQLRFYIAELGLSPSSRGRLGSPGPAPNDADEDLD